MRLFFDRGLIYFVSGLVLSGVAKYFNIEKYTIGFVALAFSIYFILQLISRYFR